MSKSLKCTRCSINRDIQLFISKRGRELKTCIDCRKMGRIRCNRNINKKKMKEINKNVDDTKCTKKMMSTDDKMMQFIDDGIRELKEDNYVLKIKYEYSDKQNTEMKTYIKNIDNYAKELEKKNQNLENTYNNKNTVNDIHTDDKIDCYLSLVDEIYDSSNSLVFDIDTKCKKNELFDILNDICPKNRDFWTPDIEFTYHLVNNDDEILFDSKLSFNIYKHISRCKSFVNYYMSLDDNKQETLTSYYKYYNKVMLLCIDKIVIYNT